MALTPSCRARSDVGLFVNEDEADIATTNTTAKSRSAGCWARNPKSLLMRHGFCALPAPTRL